MKDTAQSVSEWHRRVTSQKLIQKGVPVDLDKFPIGSNAYFYKPPYQGDVITTNRKAKHLDHYVGPGVIESRIGDKSFVISYRPGELILGGVGIPVFRGYIPLGGRGASVAEILSQIGPLEPSKPLAEVSSG